VESLKKDIHPVFKKTIVTCACGNSFEAASVKEKLHVDICSNCHPFYTGKQKLVDSGGRVDKFNKRFGIK
jgi:large subunit ribosomal protein L31